MAVVYQICIGPALERSVLLSPGLEVIPLPPVGCAAEAAYIENFLSRLSVKVEGSLEPMTARFKPAIAIQYQWEVPTDRDVDALVDEAVPILSKARSIVGLLTGEAYEPFVTIATHESSPDEIVFPVTLPRIRGLRLEAGNLISTAGPARSEPEILFDCLTDDPRLERCIKLYHLATLQEDAEHRIAHLYMCLTAIASGIRTRFPNFKEADSARAATGYGYGESFALFQIEGECPFALDHIGVARVIRDTVYHAGQIDEGDLKKFRGGWKLFDRHPHLIAFALAADCLRQFRLWPARSVASDAFHGRPMTEPTRQSASPAPRWHFLAEQQPGSACAGIRVSGATTSDLTCEGRFSSPPAYTERNPELSVSIGKGPVVDGVPLGYELRFANAAANKCS